MVIRDRTLSEGSPHVLATGNTTYRKAKDYVSKRGNTGNPRRTNSKTEYSTDEEFASYQKKYKGAGGSRANLTSEQAISLAEGTLEKEWKKHIEQVYPGMDYLSDKIDQLDLTKDVREDVAKTFERRKGTEARNRARYGIDLTRAQQQQMEGNLQRGEASALAGGLTRARAMTKDLQEQLEAGQFNLSLAGWKRGMADVTSGGMAGYQNMANYQTAKTQHRAGLANTILDLGIGLFG